MENNYKINRIDYIKLDEKDDDDLPINSQSTWVTISSYFADNSGQQLVSHQVDSYDNFIENDIPGIIKEHNPILIN